MPFRIILDDTPIFLEDGLGDQYSPERGEWEHQAACRSFDVDPRIFFSNKQNELSEARRICGGCPVRVQCRAKCESGHNRGYDVGMWAGTTYNERKRERST